MNKENTACRSSILTGLFAWIALALIPVNTMAADVLYVTDMLQLELYATVDMIGAPVRRLKSGDRLEVLETRNRRTRVRLDNGEIGWVKSLYLVEKEPARTRLNSVEKTNADLEATAEKLRGQLSEQKKRVQQLESARSGEDAQLADDAAELKRLRIENEDMRGSLSAYAGSVPISWFLACLLLVLAGGFALGWYWFDSRSRARHGGYRIH